MNPEDRLFGEIAIKLGLVPRAELGRRVEEMRARPGELGAILLEAGLLNQGQVATVAGHMDRILRQRGAPPAGPAGNAAGEAELRGGPRRHSLVPAAQAEVAQRPSLAPSPTLDASSSANPFLHHVLALAVKQDVSDVHLHSGSPLSWRRAGCLCAAEGVALSGAVSAADAEKMIAQILSPEQWRRVAEEGSIDFAYALPGAGRFRVNVYRQQRGMDAVFRVIPEGRRTLTELGLPDTLRKLMDFRTGLVLFTGPAGSGKSTTLAAMLDALVQERKEHVITLEDPIEHLFQSTSSWVNQRQVSTHTASFGRALRAALREDPDIIALTELRDRESIGLALSAAETGHLVLATVNTNNAGQTISRIVNAFPGEEQGHVRSMLSESLRAVISQRLVPTIDGSGRVPAVEVLISTTAVANLIREDKTFQLPSVMQTGSALGMIMLDNSLLQWVQSGKISKEQAARFANSKERFK